MKFTVKVEGLREIQDALHELPKATAKNIMLRVLLARGELVAEAARKLVPVKAGHLLNSINVSRWLTRRQRAKHRKAGRNDVQVFVGPGADPAAHLQEFGTSKEPAQPFMRPAWDATQQDVLDGVKDDMWAEIEKVVWGKE